MSLEQASTPPQQKELTPDLAFVAQLDRRALRKRLSKKYERPQKDRTAFQKEMAGVTFKLEQPIASRIEQYGISEQTIHVLYDAVEKRAREIGIQLEYWDLTGLVEDVLYKNDVDANETHSETARSDGKWLFLEQDLVKTGGIISRLYNLLHVGFGHMTQWSTTDPDMAFTKEQAWALGYRNHDKSPESVLEAMQVYEFEAGMVGIIALQQIGASLPNITPEELERVVQFFTDFTHADNQFIIDHYRGKKSKVESYFIPGQTPPRLLTAPKIPAYLQRGVVEIGFIQRPDKTTQQPHPNH